MRIKRAFSRVFPVLALLIVTGCGGSGGSDPIPPSVDPDNNGTPPDNTDPDDIIHEPIPGDDFADVFPKASAGATGFLKDNLAGIWIITEADTSTYVTAGSTRPLTTHSISRSIVRIYPPIFDALASQFFPGTLAAQVSCIQGGIAISPDPDATDVIFVENIDSMTTPKLTIVSDTRMERRTGDGYVVWQKIDLPTDENGDPIIGTVNYNAAGIRTFSGATNIHCLSQIATQTAEGDDASNAPLLLTQLRLGSGSLASTDLPSLSFTLIFATYPPPAASQDSLLVSGTRLPDGEELYDQRFTVDLDDVEYTDGVHLLDTISVSATNDDASIALTWQLNN